jgi:hypothetical protein
MTKDFPTNEVEQIDALLHLNANGSLTSPVPGLAIDLLKKYRAHLSDDAQPASLADAIDEIDEVLRVRRSDDAPLYGSSEVRDVLEKHWSDIKAALSAQPPAAPPAQPAVMQAVLDRMVLLWSNLPSDPDDDFQNGYNAALRVAAMHAKAALASEPTAAPVETVTIMDAILSYLTKECGLVYDDLSAADFNHIRGLLNTAPHPRSSAATDAEPVAWFCFVKSPPGEDESVRIRAWTTNAERARSLGEVIGRDFEPLYRAVPQQAAEIDQLHNTIDLLERNSEIQGKLLADTARERDQLRDVPQAAQDNLLAEFFSHSAVDEAMQDAWNDICTDTGCHPLDIEHGRGKHLTFKPSHWANQVAKRLFLRAVKVQLKADASVSLSRPQRSTGEA